MPRFGPRIVGSPAGDRLQSRARRRARAAESDNQSGIGRAGNEPSLPIPVKESLSDHASSTRYTRSPWRSETPSGSTDTATGRGQFHRDGNHRGYADAHVATGELARCQHRPNHQGRTRANLGTPLTPWCRQAVGSPSSRPCPTARHHPESPVMCGLGGLITRVSKSGVQRQVRSPFRNIEPANRPRI